MRLAEMAMNVNVNVNVNSHEPPKGLPRNYHYRFFVMLAFVLGGACLGLNAPLPKLKQNSWQAR